MFWSEFSSSEETARAGGAGGGGRQGGVRDVYQRTVSPNKTAYISPEVSDTSFVSVISVFKSICFSD